MSLRTEARRQEWVLVTRTSQTLRLDHMRIGHLSQQFFKTRTRQHFFETDTEIISNIKLRNVPDDFPRSLQAWVWWSTWLQSFLFHLSLCPQITEYHHCSAFISCKKITRKSILECALDYKTKTRTPTLEHRYVRIKISLRKQGDDEELTQPWEFKLELTPSSTEIFKEVLMLRRRSQGPSDDNVTVSGGIGEDDTEKWVRRLQTCVPKRVTFDMKYSAATKLTDKSKMKELEDGDTKPASNWSNRQQGIFLTPHTMILIESTYTTLFQRTWIYPRSGLPLHPCIDSRQTRPRLNTCVLMIFLYVVYYSHRFRESMNSKYILCDNITKTSELTWHNS